jgi:hypothetical protein
MPTRGHQRLALVTGAIAAISLALAAASASAASIGGFGVRPAYSDPHNPATRAYFIIHAGGGSTRREAVIVTNGGTKPLVLEVDAVDGLTGVTSGVVYANRGVPVHGAGAWVTPTVRRVTVPPHNSTRVRFTVAVPTSARPGDHVAGIAFEALQPTKSASSFSVTVVVRTVVGIEVEVPGPAAPQVRIYSLALAPLPGTTIPSAVVTLEDVGRRLCRPQLAVALTGQNATTRATQTLGTILPGDRIAYPFRWPGALSEGRYDVSATSTGCGPAVLTRTIAAFALPSTRAGSSSPHLVGPTAPLATASNGSSWWLYVLVGLAALLAAGLAARFRVLRRRGASPR